MRNIHFLLHNEEDVDGWPFFRELRDLLKPSYVITFTSEVLLNYPHRWQLAIFGYPKLLLSSLRTSIQSVCHKPSADKIVVEEHLQVWPLVLIYMVAGRYLFRKPKIIFLGFLFTERTNRFHNTLRRWYFSRLLAQVDTVIVFSKSEHDWLKTRFPKAAQKFAHLHYGLGDHTTTAKHALKMANRVTSKNDSPNRPLRIFTAGRSGRDYQTLVEACEMLDFPFSLTIVCDSKNAFPDHLSRPWTRVLRNCYQHEYTNEMINSDVIVVPLTDSQISSGQMVVMHGLACGKPIILSATPTSIEYFSDVRSVRLTPTGSSVAIASQLEDIRDSVTHDITWLSESRDYFEQRFSIECYAQRVALALTNKA